ncbi:MAG TPA: hypothetical protein VHU15_05050 [Stellaceae bacterium]|nr:hypothetical protein [Stellaceae bacterium]
MILLSAPAAGLSAGPGWWRALIAAARAAVPQAQCTALLDCGDDAGAAQGAIRTGVEAVVFSGRADVAERLADIAGQRNAKIVTARPPGALDLAEFFFADPDQLLRRCRDVLALVTRA